jgi:thiazole synthase
VACAWAFQLQQQLELANTQMDRYAKRIVDLEDRLSDTDEGLSQNTAAMAVKIKEAGASSVMPAGSPIGSGQGVLNPNAIRIILELLKENDPDYPVIVDAGVGTASDVTQAMELGADGVLLNTGIAHAADPVRMAHAMGHALEAGRLAARAGRIPKKLYATASSPWDGLISYIPGE